MADIEWTDGSVPMSLGSPRNDPANRFFEVVPNYEHVGPIRVALTRAIHAFTFREDYTVSVVIKHLHPSQEEDALALKRWLMIGGEVTLNTDDVNGASYSSLQLAPGTTPEIANDDDERQHFSFTCVLASDDPITVDYDG
jgi:hypothetical protein